VLNQYFIYVILSKYKVPIDTFEALNINTKSNKITGHNFYALTVLFHADNLFKFQKDIYY